MLAQHATVLLVGNVRRATNYYRNALGFETEHYVRMPEHYGYGHRDACHIHFARWNGVGARPNGEVVPPDVFDVYVDDVEGLCGELVERGAEIVHGPVDQGYGLREFRVSDPDGYILAFGRRHSRVESNRGSAS